MLKNALFVCLGNSCRSQMAEGFARKYGSDVLHSWSAGLAPAPIVQPLTQQVMQAKNIDISDQFPKSVNELELDAFDIVFNMSGLSLPTHVRGEVRVWNVLDPMLQSEQVYCEVRDQIEDLVMQYILELRRQARSPRPLALPANSARPKGEATTVSRPTVRVGFGRMRPLRDDTAPQPLRSRERPKL